MKTKILLSLIACGFMMSGVDAFDYSLGHKGFVNYIRNIDPNIGALINDTDYNILDIIKEFTDTQPPHIGGHHCVNLLPERLDNLYELIDNINNMGLPANTQQQITQLIHGAITYTKMILRRYGYDI